MTSFVAPTIDYVALLPMLILFGAACVGILLEAFLARRFRLLTQQILTVLSLVAAVVAAVVSIAKHQAEPVQTAGVAAKTGRVAGAVAVDGPAIFLQITILVLALLTVFVMVERFRTPTGAFAAMTATAPGSAEERLAAQGKFFQSEVFPLFLFAVAGMWLFPAANDLLTMFVALEVLSLPLYLLTGMARRRRILSQEASLKYFLLGAFASAFFAFGIAMFYGFAGSVRLDDIAQAIVGETSAPVVGHDALLLLGIFLVVVGLLFKIGAVPFQQWVPDVYQGAPTPIAGFMASATKVAAVGALLRVLYVAVPAMRWDLTPVLVAISILTMFVGAIIALVQTDIKRMLAYSSIAHAGFILTGVVAMDRTGIQGVLFYLATYGIATVGIFAVVALVRGSAEASRDSEASHLSQWAGFGHRHPVTAAAVTILLLTLMGIPLTSGFMGKFLVFSAALAHGAWIATVLGVIASAIAAFFYARVIVLMYFMKPTGTSLNEARVLEGGLGSKFTIGLCVAASILLGVLPSLLTKLAESSSLFLV